MTSQRQRVVTIWGRTVSLGWPIAIEQVLNTLMRTVDIIVTGLFSPAAVAAVGIADLYAQLPLRIGLGLGSGAIALSSQDTGRGAEETRNQAVTHALLIGFAIGVPIILIGWLLGNFLIAILGAESEVVVLGGTYLMLIFAASPFRIVGLIGAKALQGTGDTRTPMIVNGVANIINIVGTVALGLGLWGLPRLGIVGVGVATLIARTFEGLVMVWTIHSSVTPLAIVRPRNWTITRQLIAIGTPNFAEGMTTTLAEFPFNAILLLFGTEPNAAFHIGRRIHQQITGPFYRSFSTVASIIVGQRLGEGDPDEARFSGAAILALGIITLAASGAFLLLAAPQLARIFTRDPVTIAYSIDFIRVFGVSMIFFGIFFPIAGALRGAGDTRTPFYARLTGSVIFLLAFSYYVGVILGYGLPGIYVGVILNFVTWALIAVVGFRWGNWAEHAATMMAERAEGGDEIRPLN